MIRTYRIHDLQPYINWAYFYHAWQLHDPVEQQKNRAEAEDILRQLDARYQVYALFELFDCHSHNDDIVISVKGQRSTDKGQKIPEQSSPTRSLSKVKGQNQPSSFVLRPSSLDIVVLDDGTSSNATRLGAVKDIDFAIDKLKLDDDLLVMAGDNLLDFSLEGFIRYAKEKNATCVMRYYEADEARLHKTGVAEIDTDGRILSMEEKPANPKSHWCIPAFYYYTREDARLIKKGIASGCGIDAPGSFIAWLSTQTPVYTYEMPGKRYDIGTLESYEQVKATYTGPSE